MSLAKELERRRSELIRDALRNHRYPAAGRGLDVLPMPTHEIDWGEPLDKVTESTRKAFEVPKTRSTDAQSSKEAK